MMKMTVHGGCTAVLVMCVIASCLQPSSCTYLSYPRIHFVGQHRADASTRNNDHCDFRMDEPVSSVINEAEWGKNGTQEFQLFDTTVTSVVYEDGKSSTDDSIVGHSIIGNLQRPFAKFVDLDVDVQLHSTIYGLQFGISWNDSYPEENIAFHGEWTKNIMTQNLWTPLKCYNPDHHGGDLYQSSLSYGVESTTIITDIDWNNMGNSQALDELKTKSLELADGKLSVRITQMYFTRNYHPYRLFNATLGYVYGVIGVPSPNDTVSIPGQRTMFYSETNFPIGMEFSNTDLCYLQKISDFGHWMNTAPFEVDDEMNQIRVDLSNSIPSDISNNLRNIGNLRLGYLEEVQGKSCVYLLGDDIPYLTTAEKLRITSGIYNINVPPSEMKTIIEDDVQFVIVQVIEGDEGPYNICTEGVFTTGGYIHTAQILLQENTYFVRPKDYYQAYLDQYEKPEATITFYVSKHGKPAEGVVVRMKPYNHLAPDFDVIPSNGVFPLSSELTTDELGLVSFTFRVTTSIPEPRQYGKPVCTQFDNSTTIPIDGQVYCFSFCAVYNNKCVDSDIQIRTRAFSDYTIPDEPTWVDDIEPIFKVFVRMAPIMNAILNMSNYTDVIKVHNINLLNYSLRLDHDDVSHMPVTRDLSPAQRDTILKWLDQETPPKYSHSTYPVIPEDEPVCNVPKSGYPRSHSVDYFKPPRCEEGKLLRFSDYPEVEDSYFSAVYDINSDSAKFLRHQFGAKIPGRPLFETSGKIFTTLAAHSKSRYPYLICSVENVKTQLQTAIQLEWATIPTYATTLYSNGEGCNPEVYELIRSVVMQEMLHMVQSANILIALNGSPLVDSKDVAPSFPGKLPGHVLPGLTVKLEKLSLRHVHDIFMAIEVPSEFLATDPPITDPYAYTIGRFYKEIEFCIEQLDQNGEITFNASTMYDRQVKWPWTPSSQLGDVVLIDSAKTATDGIEMIISQGEGANLFDSYDIANNSLAHFFKFEEIVCQHRLVQINATHYSYSGDYIPLNASGVWNMRNNPKVSDVPPHSNCYTYSKTFHNTYRAFLRKLQRVFNGYPDEIIDSVVLMESLLVHAKSLMWTKYDPHNQYDDTTCGPVWDYEWPENQ